MSTFNIDKVISQLKNWNKKTNEKLHLIIRECHVAKHLFSILNCNMEEFLNDVEEHDTLDRDEDHEEEVINPVMSESEDSSDSGKEQRSTCSSPKKFLYDFEFIKTVEWRGGI